MTDITLDDGSTVITLPEDLQLLNDLEWTGAAHVMDIGLDGAAIYQHSSQNGGEPIVLTGGDWAWITRADVIALKAMAAQPGQLITLTYSDARAFECVFDQERPLEAPAVSFEGPPASDDKHWITLRLLTLPAS